MEDQILFNAVLVADDSPINQIFMQRALQKICLRIDVAENGVKAVELAKANEYDLILMDLFMPEMDGYEATEILRKELNLKTRIIAITAISLPGEEQKSIDAGMDGYIIKPFTTETIKQIAQSGRAKPVMHFDSDHIFGDNELKIDLKILYALGDTTPEYISMMISVFTENMEPTIKQLYQLLAEKNIPELQRKAHYAKSSLAVIQIGVLFNLAKDIELDCKTEQPLESIESKIRRFEELFKRAKLYLNTYLETLLVQKS